MVVDDGNDLITDISLLDANGDPLNEVQDQSNVMAAMITLTQPALPKNRFR